MRKNRQYRIITATIAMLPFDDRRKTVTVTENEIVTIRGATKDGDALIDVVWRDQIYWMFPQDLRDRGTELEQDSAGAG